MDFSRAFDHISEPYRGKVAQDFLDHLKGNEWDEAKYNPLNDYQRHLHALFLRIAGNSYTVVWAQLYALAEDVQPRSRSRYIDEVLHSEIVGFPRKDGSLIPIPKQEVVEA